MINKYGFVHGAGWSRQLQGTCGILLGFIFLALSGAHAQEEKVLRELQQILELEPEFDAAKVEHIDSLRRDLNNIPIRALEARYQKNEELFNEYNIFKQDSAFVYGLKAKDVVVQLDSTPLVASFLP